MKFPLAFVFLIACVIGGYFIYRNNQDRIEKQKQEEISRIQGKYDTANSQVDLLILTEEEQANINTQLESIKKALEEKNITEEINNTVESINKTIEEIKTNNTTLLTNKENELNGINIDRFNEEQRNKVTELQNQYHELKEQSNYKQAQAKIQEVIDYVNNTNGEITKAEEEERARQEEENRVNSNSNKTSTTNNYTPIQKPTATAPVQQQQAPTQQTAPVQQTPTQQTPVQQPSTPVLPTQPTKPTSLNVSVNPTYTITETNSRYAIKVGGTITNNSNWNLGFIRVDVDVYSSNNVKIKTIPIIYNNRLNAGETALLYREESIYKSSYS